LAASFRDIAFGKGGHAMSTIRKTTSDEFTELTTRGYQQPTVFAFVRAKDESCKAMSAILEGVAKKREEVSFYMVDMDASPDIVEQVGVKDSPTLVVYYRHNPIGAHRGFMDREKLDSWLEQLRP
jgi:thioredoxin 1